MKKEYIEQIEIINAYGGSFIIPSELDCIGRILKETGQFETSDIERVSQYLDRCKPNKSKRKYFVDIGANIGTHSLSALKEHNYDKLIAIEPAHHNYCLLTANLCLSGLMDRCNCMQAAASDIEGFETLYHNKENCGDHRLNNKPNESPSQLSEDKETVKTIDTVNYLREHLGDVNLNDVLCWVDTQGHEIPILSSLRPLILQGLPIVIELWPFGMERQSYKVEQLSTLLSETNLKIAHIRENTIEPIDILQLPVLWKDLREKDTETPGGASYTNILIYAVSAHKEIHPYELNRIEMTVRCRDSLDIPKVEGAGDIFEDGDISYQLMHNGLKVVKDGYYGAWMSELINQLKGHHEPQEEKVFDEICKKTSTDGLMLEIGCFWAYYSLWYLKDNPNRSAVGLEPDTLHMQIGQKNALLNRMDKQINILNGVASETPKDSVKITTETGEDLVLKGYTIKDLMNYANKDVVEIVHCDAQGAETFIVDQIIELGKNQMLRFCIISTHSYEITGDPLTHQKCLAKINEAGAHIIAEHDVHESYSGDGLIAASFSSQDKDFKVEISCNRYSESLFPSPAVHLSNTLNEIQSIRINNENDTSDQKEKKQDSLRKRIARKINTLLHN